MECTRYQQNVCRTIWSCFDESREAEDFCCEIRISDRRSCVMDQEDELDKIEGKNQQERLRLGRRRQRRRRERQSIVFHGDCVLLLAIVAMFLICGNGDEGYHLFVVGTTTASSSKQSKIASSSLLEISKIYQKRPPHDSSLYDVLGVRSNATIHEIQKAYRKESRRYHPDKVKQRQQQQQGRRSGESDEEKLEHVRRAYEILRNDGTRLPYHKYGLVDTDMAVAILKGKRNRLASIMTAETTTATTRTSVEELLQLMGYSPNTNHHHPPAPTNQPTANHYHQPNRHPTQQSPQQAQYHHQQQQQQYHPNHYHPNNNYYQQQQQQQQQHQPQSHYSYSGSTGVPPPGRGGATTAYPLPPPPPPRPPSSNNNLKEQDERILFLAINLLEQIRPIVEGDMKEPILAHIIAEQCDRLKKLPLGAQIIRCIGGAYRISGQKILRKHKQQMKLQQRQLQRQQQQRNQQEDEQKCPYDYQTNTFHNTNPDFTDKFRDKVRCVKHIFTAAVATGKVVITEQHHKLKQSRHERKHQQEQKQQKRITYHWEGEIGEFAKKNDLDDLGQFVDVAVVDNNDNNSIENRDHDSELNKEKFKKEQKELKEAQNAILQCLQVEALWKISKIQLDKTIQEACELILTGKYFFFPSHNPSQHQHQQQHQYPNNYDQSGHYSGNQHHYNHNQHNNHNLPNNQNDSSGWVGSNGNAIDVNIGRLRAAASLVMIGDIMIRCSKDGTSWVD